MDADIVKITGRQDKIQKFLSESDKYDVIWDLIESGVENRENDGAVYTEEEQLAAIDTSTSKVDNSGRSCNNCKLYRIGECAGLGGLCDDYKYAPTISEEELENWLDRWGPYDSGFVGRRKKGVQ